jgi:magnesium transporter
MLKLDSTRNHLLAVDVVFSLITVSLTFVMFVTGAFGMNLNSGLEQSTGVFSGVILGCVLVCIVIVALGLWYFRRKGVLMI